jgi:hypothetical protein
LTGFRCAEHEHTLLVLVFDELFDKAVASFFVWGNYRVSLIDATGSRNGGIETVYEVGGDNKNQAVLLAILLIESRVI